MQDLSTRPRAETVSIRNVHALYRVFKLPGVRQSGVYDGTGIVKTYMMENPEVYYPDDENAVPILTMTEDGDQIMDKEIEHEPLVCPDCHTEGRRDFDGEPICPDCGLILHKGDTGTASDDDQTTAEDEIRLDRTANSAERYVGVT